MTPIIEKKVLDYLAVSKEILRQQAEMYKMKANRNIRRCARCFLMELCEQYPAKSWMENGTLDTPVEYLCAVAHAQARYLGLITEQENAWEIMDWKERVDGFTAVPRSFES